MPNTPLLEQVPIPRGWSDRPCRLSFDAWRMAVREWLIDDLLMPADHAGPACDMVANGDTLHALHAGGFSVVMCASWAYSAGVAPPSQPFSASRRIGQSEHGFLRSWSTGGASPLAISFFIDILRLELAARIGRGLAIPDDYTCESIIPMTNTPRVVTGDTQLNPPPAR